MYFSNKIRLRRISRVQDADGFWAETPHDKEVWADVQSVRRSEFYSAKGINVDLVMTFIVKEYGGEPLVVYRSKVYDVVRAFQNHKGDWELNCSDKGVD